MGTDNIIRYIRLFDITESDIPCKTTVNKTNRLLRPLRVGPGSIPVLYTSLMTDYNKTNRSIKPKGSGPKVVLLSGGYYIDKYD